jgi:hypothetical protein
MQCSETHRVTTSEAIAGMPALVVRDNTKVAVIKACLYDQRSIATTPKWRRITAQPSCRRATAPEVQRRDVRIHHPLSAFATRQVKRHSRPEGR